MTVSYFFRKPSGLYSIERVFQTIQAAMPPCVTAQNVYCRYARGIRGRIRNIVQAQPNQSEVNHITGDVHYLALSLEGRRTVLTIHDCGSMLRARGLRRRLIRLFWFEYPTRRVAAVTVISEATKRDLLRLTTCPEHKITVIPNPLPAGFVPAQKRLCAEEPQLLQVGTLQNKNIERTAAALKGIRCRLTIIGRLSQSQFAALNSNRVNYRVMSDLSDDALLAVYRETDVVLFCSTSEGFGMPVIEANGIGRAVVTSDIEPLRTIANGAACLVDPLDTASIRNGLLKVLTDESYRAELIQRGIANAARFDPGTVARQYLDVYERILSAGAAD